MRCWGQDSRERKGSVEGWAFSAVTPCPLNSNLYWSLLCCLSWIGGWTVCILLICLCFNIYESHSAMKSMTTAFTKTDTDTDRCELKCFSSEPAISGRVLFLGTVCFICWFGDALTYRSQWYERREKHEAVGGCDPRKFVGTRAEWFGLLPFKH